MKQILLFFLLFTVITSSASSQSSVPLWKTLPEVPAMPKADQSGLVPVNDISLYYGLFNKKGKNPVILLHGAFVSSDIWGFEVPLLMKTHQVIVVGSRGHGRSTLSNQPLTYNLMAEDILQLMNKLRIEKASVVGWSDGGIIGMILAIRHPERINKLFTFGSNYDLSGYKTEEPDSAMSVKFMSRAQNEYSRLSATPGNFTGLKKALGKMYDTEPNLKPAQLKTIQSPTVIAYGQYEQFIKPEHFQELARLIPRAKLVMIPNVGHGGPLQDPVRFHQAVIALLVTPTRAQQVDTAKENQAIRQLVKNYEDAWNHHDPKALAANYRSDATWVNWFGAYYSGRQDIEYHYRTTHNSYFKLSHYYTRSVEDIEYLKPEIAIVHVRTGLTDDTRYPGETFEFRRMMVLSKKDGIWLIQAGQNAKLEKGIK